MFVPTLFRRCLGDVPYLLRYGTCTGHVRGILRLTCAYAAFILLLSYTFRRLTLSFVQMKHDRMPAIKMSMAEINLCRFKVASLVFKASATTSPLRIETEILTNGFGNV
jgi:hypothetical protein